MRIRINLSPVHHVRLRARSINSNNSKSLQAILLVVWLTPVLADTSSEAAALDERLTQIEADLRVQRYRAADAEVRATRLQGQLNAALERLEDGNLDHDEQPAAQLTSESGSLQNAAFEIERLREGERQHTAALDELRAENATLAGRSAGFEQALNAARSEHAALAEQLQLARTKLVEAERQLGQLQETFEAAKQSAAATEDRLQSLVTELQQMTDQQAGELDTLGIERLQLRQELKQAKSMVTAVTIERDELAQANAALQQQTADVEEKLATAQRKLRTSEAALATTRRERAQTQQSVDDARKRNDELIADIADLERRLGESVKTVGDLQRALATLQSNVPSMLGGTATRDELQAKARQQADILRSAYRAWRTDRQNTVLLERLKKAENNLYIDQLQLAGLLADGRGVHRFLARESLSLVAQSKYGSQRHWRKIYDANAHILDDPDQVLPGMTIVLP